ncbi:hypothetical protein BV913_12615, partial [Neisseria dumasiana]
AAGTAGADNRIGGEGGKPGLAAGGHLGFFPPHQEQGLGGGEGEYLQRLGGGGTGAGVFLLFSLPTSRALAAEERIPDCLLLHAHMSMIDIDTLRRGTPTFQIQYDLTTGLLPGHSLQTLAID